MTSTWKAFSWTMMTISIFVVLMASLISAAPPGSPSNEDLLGSRVYYRNRENMPNAEDNIIPITLDNSGQQATLYDRAIFSPQQPSENALLNFLLTRRLALGNNRLRSYVDSSSNEISRKRSYSKYCAFNAVSCFGK